MSEDELSMFKLLWPHVAIAGLLVAATVISAAAGRKLEAVIAGMLSLPPLGVLALEVVGRNKGFIRYE